MQHPKVTNPLPEAMSNPGWASQIINHLSYMWFLSAEMVSHPH